MYIYIYTYVHKQCIYRLVLALLRYEYELPKQALLSLVSASPSNAEDNGRQAGGPFGSARPEQVLARAASTGGRSRTGMSLIISIRCILQ